MATLADPWPRERRAFFLSLQNLFRFGDLMVVHFVCGSGEEEDGGGNSASGSKIVPGCVWKCTIATMIAHLAVQSGKRMCSRSTKVGNALNRDHIDMWKKSEILLTKSSKSQPSDVVPLLCYPRVIIFYCTLHLPYDVFQPPAMMQ
jgi:hypothetical protein